jgi:RND family efflux transporter MFP subunit
MRYSVLLLASALLAGCGGNVSMNGNNDSDDNQKRDSIAEARKITEVTVEKLQVVDFNHEIVSNGRVTGHTVAQLYFPASDRVITQVNVKNGSRVRRGDKLASLDTYTLEFELEQAITALQKSELDYKDALIGQGFDPDHQETIPEDVRKLAKLRSGYTDAEANVAKIKFHISESTVTAPVDGTVANLSGKIFNRPDASKPFCSIIAQGMDVEFKIMEGELALLDINDKVKVVPFSSSEQYPGRVTEINPVVDGNGLVSVVATVDGSKGLYDGMNVKVSLYKSLGKQMVVPKSAVLIRNGREVVFTLSDDKGRAMWNYVATGLENMTQYTITEGLELGMDVIVSGNVNLAHEAPVTVIEDVVM